MPDPTDFSSLRESANAPTKSAAQLRELAYAQIKQRIISCEYRPGDAEMVGQADLHRLQSLADLRPQFASLLVVEEQGGALGVQEARRLAHHFLQQRAELDVGSDLGNDVDELHLLASADPAVLAQHQPQ